MLLLMDYLEHIQCDIDGRAFAVINVVAPCISTPFSAQLWCILLIYCHKSVRAAVRRVGCESADVEFVKIDLRTKEKMMHKME